jgi:hypothetical protein
VTKAGADDKGVFRDGQKRKKRDETTETLATLLLDIDLTNC